MAKLRRKSMGLVVNNSVDRFVVGVVNFKHYTPCPGKRDQ